jgi:ferric-dicitrate binding protein FerR (iron transport regulator)
MKKKLKNSKEYWKRLAARMSGEPGKPLDRFTGLSEGDDQDLEKKWNEIGMTNSKKEIDVNRAWEKVVSRIREDGLMNETVPVERFISRKLLIRIAASVIVVAGLGALIFSIVSGGRNSNLITLAAGVDQKNVIVSLPDGSNVWLNRNSTVSYSKEFGKDKRALTLTGEAFFEIAPDTENPFVIEAGKGKITVVGTTFNVISNNEEDEAEVYVTSGKVMLSDNSGNKGTLLEPEFVGKIGEGTPSVSVNKNPNYLSWKTDLLVFDNEKLDVVFKDLKKVYNITIDTNDPDILNSSITATYDREPADTIIDLICTTFTLSYRKDGNIYHLSKR